MVGLRKLAGAILLLGLVAAPAFAKKPVAADEAAVRDIVRQVYAGYNRVIEDSPEVATEGYDPPYSKSLDALVQKWMPYGSGDEVLGMNDFDWYCQCQDFDAKSAKLTSQKYDAKGKDRIDAKVLFDGGEGGGEPLTFLFVRENGRWAMDDLKFGDGSTLRQGLAQDIKDGAKSAAQ